MDCLSEPKVLRYDAGVANADRTADPANYSAWLKLFASRGAKFSLYQDLPAASKDLRVFLRHDIDLFERELLLKCARLEADHGVVSTWFFLPPGDKRYNGRTHELKQLVRQLVEAGHEVGYHVNAWEVPGTFRITDDPLGQLDRDLAWYADACGRPIKIAAAHGIPHHLDQVSNLSMYEPLLDRGVQLLDPYILRHGRDGRRIPHTAARSTNPLLPLGALVFYISDSGGPIVKNWSSLDALLEPGTDIVVNTHSGNYDINRRLEYRDWHARRRIVQQEHIRWTVDHARGPSILEVGCSQGMVTMLLGRLGYQCLGISDSLTDIACARESLSQEEPTLQEKVEFRQADLRQLGNVQFDTVVLGDILLRDPDPSELLRMVAERLSPDGKVLVTIPYGFQPSLETARYYYAGELCSVIGGCLHVNKLSVISKNMMCVASKTAHADDFEFDRKFIGGLESTLARAEVEALDVKAKLKAAVAAKKPI